MLGLKQFSKLLYPIESLCKALSVNIHTSSPVSAWSKHNDPRKFLSYNNVIYPPQEEHEERRPAFVCHQSPHIKYSYKKMWYICSLIRGMSIDEALKQISFVLKKGAADVKRTLLEAQELAVTKHNVEFKSNLWVSESFISKGNCIKGIRRHARKRMGEVRYGYVHYYVKLEEGTPPEDFYLHNPLTPQQQLDKWVEGMRKRKVINSI